MKSEIGRFQWLIPSVDHLAASAAHVAHYDEVAPAGAGAKNSLIFVFVLATCSDFLGRPGLLPVLV